MVRLDTVRRHAIPPRRGGLALDDEALGALEVRLLVLVHEVDLEALLDVQEPFVDGVERLAVLAKGLDEDGLRVKDLARHVADHALQHLAPFGEVGPFVGGAQEDDGVGRDVDGSVVLVNGHAHAVRVLEGFLEENPAQAVGDPNDRIAKSLLGLAEGGEVVDQGLRVLVNEVGRGVAVLVACYVGIVAIDEDVGTDAFLLQRPGQEVGGPVDA